MACMFISDSAGYTLYCQKNSLTHPNNWNQVFQTLLWPQAKSKHLGMQSVSTNICERMDCSQVLSEFQRGTEVQSWNVPTPKYSTVNCQWYHNKVEAIVNDSNSAMNW